VKILRLALLIWSACATLVILLAVFNLRSSRTETHVFCAYGRVFVEFDDNGKVWGAIMLDYSGRPIPCQEDDDVRIQNTI